MVEGSPMALFSTYPKMRASGYLEIGRALGGHALGFVPDRGTVCAAVGNRLQKGLERRPVRVLRLLVNGRLAKRKELAVKDILIGRHCVLEDQG
jgi:hypothetical protein